MRDPAAISFAGDRESALGDPVVVARGGETNRLPLLIGIRYAVTSDVPFSVSFTDSGFATISTNGPRSAEVTWPLEFAFTEGFADGSRVYAVDVVPYDPGGVFSWEMRGGAPQGGVRSGGCGCVSYSGRTIVMGCTSTCECGGGCAATGAYMLESAIFAATGGVCRCGFDDPEPETPSIYDTTNGPSLSISFSKPAVIFEDEYVDSENGAVPRRSTRVRLTVSAYGGTRGGSLVLGAQNLGKLVAVAEGPINLPPVLTLAAQQSFYTTCVYEGGEASGEADDISLAGYFMETGTGERIDDSDTLTALRIELAPWATAPLNTNPHRHVLGIGENVNCLQYPSNPSIALQAASNWTITTLIGYAYFTCPLTSARDGITIIFRGQTYKPLISILEPTGILAVNAAPTRHGVPRGEAGGVGMELDLYVLPRTVSFSNIAMEEIECFTGTHTGYFANIEFEGEWSHTEECGAGDWHDIGQDNFFFRDNPKFKRSLPRMMEDGTITTNKAYGWKSGTLVWDIPIGWGYHGTTDDMGLEGCLDGYQQVFEIFPDGLSGVQKFSNHVMRSTNDVIHLNGVKVP